MRILLRCASIISIGGGWDWSDAGSGSMTYKVPGASPRATKRVDEKAKIAAVVCRLQD
jgi:hypothetical protein